MSEEQSKEQSEADAELEREIRRGRKFSLAEAIGRLAGPGAMKGVSPISRKHQAGVEVENYLRRHLTDPGGALETVLLRRVRESDIMLNNYEQPLLVLAAYIQRVLDSDHLLTEIVREADIEWGRVLGERPHFEKEGCTPHADDPYTLESVRNTFCKLLEKLAVEPR